MRSERNGLPASGWGLPRLHRATLRAMQAAGAEIVECLRVLEEADLNLVGEVLRGHGTFFELEHYPPQDVFDVASHSQYLHRRGARPLPHLPERPGHARWRQSGSLRRQ